MTNENDQEHGKTDASNIKFITGSSRYGGNINCPDGMTEEEIRGILAAISRKNEENNFGTRWLTPPGKVGSHDLNALFYQNDRGSHSLTINLGETDKRLQSLASIKAHGKVVASYGVSMSFHGFAPRIDGSRGEFYMLGEGFDVIRYHDGSFECLGGGVVVQT